MFRTAALYIIAAWVTLQVADLAFPGLGIPEDAIRYVWVGAFLCFPLAVLFGWLYQITPQGIVRTVTSGTDQATDISLKGIDYALLTVLVLVAGSEFTRSLEILTDEPRFQALVAGLELPTESPDH